MLLIQVGLNNININADSITNANVNIATNQVINIIANKLNSANSFISANSGIIINAQDIKNTNTKLSANSIDISANTLTNNKDSAIYADNILLKANNLINKASKISANNDVIIIADNFTNKRDSEEINSGLTYAGGDIQLTIADTFANIGKNTIAIAQGNLNIQSKIIENDVEQIIAVKTINNQGGRLVAGGNIYIKANALNNNQYDVKTRGGLIYALGDIKLAINAYLNNKFSSIISDSNLNINSVNLTLTNEAGDIKAEKNVYIKADIIDNLGVAYDLKGAADNDGFYGYDIVSKEYDYYFDKNNLSMDYKTYFPNLWSYYRPFSRGDTVLAVLYPYMNRSKLLLKKNVEITLSSYDSKIHSGSNMNLIAKTIGNLDSEINANKDLTIEVDNLINKTHYLDKVQILVNQTFFETITNKYILNKEREVIGGNLRFLNYYPNEGIDLYGNSFSKNSDGGLEFYSGPGVGAKIKTAIIYDKFLDVLYSLNKGKISANGNLAIDAKESIINSKESIISSNPLFTNSESTIDKDSIATDISEYNQNFSKSRDKITLLGNDAINSALARRGQFIIKKPTTKKPYVIETRKQFLNVNNAIKFSPLLKLLSPNANYNYWQEQEIQRQLATQKKLPRVHDDKSYADLLQDLYSNSGKEYQHLTEKGFNLSPGISLSKEIIDSLDRDIVWYEEQEGKVDGKAIKALLPRVYLANAKIKNLEKDVQALLQDNNVIIKSAGVVENHGLINASGINANILADAFIDTSGKINTKDLKITANKVSIKSTDIKSDLLTINSIGDMLNINAKIKAQNVNLKGNNIIFKDGEYNLGIGSNIKTENLNILAKNNFINTSLGRIDSIKANIKAKDVLISTNIKTSNSLNINSDGDINISRGTISAKDKLDVYSLGNINLKRAVIHSGNSLNLNSGRDINIRGTISAKDKLDVSSLGNINLKRAVIHSGNSLNLAVKKDLDVDGYINTRGKANLHSDGNVNILSKNLSFDSDLAISSLGNINIMKSNLNVKNDLSLVAKKDLNVLSEVNKVNILIMQKRSNIDVGKDAYLYSGRSTNIAASDIDVGGKLSVSSLGNINLKSAISFYNEKHWWTKRWKRNWWGKKTTKITNYKQQFFRSDVSRLSADKGINLNANRDVFSEGARLESSFGNIDLDIGRNINFKTVQNKVITNTNTRKSSSFFGFNLGSSSSSSRTKIKKHAGSYSKALNNIMLNSGGSSFHIASQLKAGNKITINAGGDVLLLSAQDREKYTEENSYSGLLTKSVSSINSDKRTTKGSNLEAKEVKISAGLGTRAVVLDASEIKAKTVEIQSSLLRLLSAKNLEYVNGTSDESGLILRKIKTQGHIKEEIVDANIEAEKLIINGKPLKETLTPQAIEQQVLQTLSSQDELTEALKAQGIDLQSVIANNKEWNESVTTLSSMGQLIVQTIIAWATYGKGTTLVGGEYVFEAGKKVLQQTATEKMMSAALQSVIQQTASSFANSAITGNELDLDTNSILKTAITSGVTAYVSHKLLGGLETKSALEGNEHEYMSMEDYTKNAVIRGTMAGVKAELNGEDFSKGFKDSLIASLLSDVSLQMRKYVTENYETKEGLSAGIFGDGKKVAGSHRNPMGKEQTDIFGSATGKGTVLGIEYSKNGFINSVVEHFGGPHDFLSNWNYDSKKNNEGVIKTRLKNDGIFITAISGILLAPSLPLAIAPSIQDNLDAVRDSLRKDQERIEAFKNKDRG